VLPDHEFGSERGVLDIGALCWIHLHVEKPEPPEKILLGKWSNLAKSENQAIAKILVLNNTPVLSKLKEAARILQELRLVLFNHKKRASLQLIHKSV
jgi:hypothetical protein